MREFIEYKTSMITDEDPLLVCGCDERETFQYRGTSLIKKRTPLGPYRRLMPRVLGES